MVPEPTFRILEVAPYGLRNGRISPEHVELYVSADIEREDVDIKLDITILPFADDAFHQVVMSHVLEHVQDDIAAIREVHRVLMPGGVFFAAVPVVADQTVEYGSPNPGEDNHCRAPGLDYYRRIERVFGNLAVFTSDDVDAQTQTYLYEDRTGYPNRVAPRRPAQAGIRHRETCAIARKSR